MWSRVVCRHQVRWIRVALDAGTRQVVAMAAGDGDADGLVRKTPSFSRCVMNHAGSLWCFIRHYNASPR